jgi:hypothetical protein
LCVCWQKFQVNKSALSLIPWFLTKVVASLWASEGQRRTTVLLRGPYLCSCSICSTDFLRDSSNWEIWTGKTLLSDRPCQVAV